MEIISFIGIVAALILIILGSVRGYSPDPAVHCGGSAGGSHRRRECV